MSRGGLIGPLHRAGLLHLALALAASGCPLPTAIPCHRAEDCPAGTYCDRLYDYCVALRDGGRPAAADAAVDAAGPGSDAAASDAGSGDAAPIDTAQPDTAASDAAAVDGLVGDALALDMAAGDAALRDGAAADSTAPDALRLDTAGLDGAQPDAPQPDTAQPDTAQPDTAQPDTGTSPCPGSPPVSAFCDPADPTQIACYSFDGNANDGSQYANHGTGYGVSYQAGHDGQAVRISGSSGSEVQVPDSSSLDVTEAVTIEAWIYPFTLPSSGRVCIVDNNGQYAMFLLGSGELQCRADTNHAVAFTAAGTWSHVACTMDVAADEIRFYIDGERVLAEPFNSSLPVDNTDYMGIGGESTSGTDNFDGLIDSLRIWSVARDDAALCWAAQP